MPAVAGLRRLVPVLAAITVAVAVAVPAQAARSATSASVAASATACIGKPYSYAGLQGATDANGVSAVLSPTAAPAVFDGHVGAWIGVGGVNAGPNGVAEWLQTGLAAFTDDRTSHLYYEVTAPGSAPAYHEVRASVAPGAHHTVALLEISGRPSSWRVWVDGNVVSPAISLPGSHDAWAPQAVAENWNGGSGTCNAYAYEFSNLQLRSTSGAWQPFASNYTFEDPGYKVVRTAQPTRFLATSVR
jgi:hypothetical protein